MLFLAVLLAMQTDEAEEREPMIALGGAGPSCDLNAMHRHPFVSGVNEIVKTGYDEGLRKLTGSMSFIQRFQRCFGSGITRTSTADADQFGFLADIVPQVANEVEATDTSSLLTSLRQSIAKLRKPVAIIAKSALTLLLFLVGYWLGAGASMFSDISVSSIKQYYKLDHKGGYEYCKESRNDECVGVYDENWCQSACRDYDRLKDQSLKGFISMAVFAFGALGLSMASFGGVVMFLKDFYPNYKLAKTIKHA